MKKFFKPLSLLVILGLVACSGKSISRAEAIEVLDGIIEKQESNELEETKVIRFELTQETKVTPNEGVASTSKETTILAADMDKKQAYFKNIEVEDGETAKEEGWIYLNDAKFYFLSDVEGEKTYSTVDVVGDGQEQFETTIAMNLLLVGFVLIGLGPEAAKGRLEELDDEDLEIDLKSETYTTKGDGHLAINLLFSAIPDEDILSGRGEMGWVFNEYRLESYNLVSDVTTEEGKESEKMNLKMNYKQSGISLPKLADFTLAT